MEMGEPAPCMMRSVSQPLFASCEYKEGDPLRALTTSISFGRFMTEPLDWERWSSFSHNRTLEDVQKYSRPGVVAEKKAFFEAHYKKIAAKKATTTKSPNKKENKAPNYYSPETNRNSDSKRSNSHSAIDDTRGNESHSAIDDTGGNESLTLVATNEYMPSGSQVEQEKASTENVLSPSIDQVFSQFVNVDVNMQSGSQVDQEQASIKNVSSPSTNQNLPQFGNVDDNVPSGSQVEQEKASVTDQVFSQFGNIDDDVPSGSQVEQEKASIEIVSSPSTNQVLSQFLKVNDDMPGGSQVEQEKTSIVIVSSPSTNQVFPLFVNVADNVPSGGQVEQEKTSIEIVSSPSTNQVLPQFVNVADNVPSGGQVEQEKASIVNVTSKNQSSQSSHDDRNRKTRIKDAANGRDKVSRQTKPEISSSKSSSKNGVFKLQTPRKAPTPPICPQKAAIIDVAEKKRSAPKSVHISMNFPPRKIIGLYSSPFSHKNGTSKAIGKPKDRPIQQALTKVSVNEVKKCSQVLPRQEIRRSKPLLDCSVNGRRTVDVKSLSINHSEASSACTKKARSSSTVPTSFSFRSEERAAKRKEFFQKLEVKSNTKEKRTIQLQPKLKEKARNDNKTLHSAPALEAKPSTSEIKAPSNKMKKERARNDNKKARNAPVLEAKPSTSETKAASNSMEKEKARNDNKEAKPSTSETKAPSSSIQKEKARNDNKELHFAPSLEAKPSSSETKSPNNSMQKVLPIRLCSPKLGKKPTPKLVLDNCYQSPWRSSSKPKNFIELNKKILSSSMASLPTKKMYDSTLMSKK